MFNLSDVSSSIDYDPLTGDFFKKGTTDKTGNVCGRGYVYLRINGHSYLAHRVALFLMTGEWPKGQIDHINRDKTDNRLANLRVVTGSQNLANTGVRKGREVKGVRYVRDYGRRKRWLAQTQRTQNGTKSTKVIGYFHTREEAYEAYLSVMRADYPEHFPL